MKTMKNAETTRLGAGGVFADWSHLFGGGVALAPEGGAFSGGDPKPADPPQDPPKDPPKADDPPKPDEPPRPSDQEARLLKEVMQKKERIEALEAKLKDFDGIDPSEVKRLLDEKLAVEAQKKEAERKAAEAAGDIERVKQMMAEEHKKEVETVQSRLAELQSALSQKDHVINDLTIGQAFATSSFVKDELVLTPSKTRVVYGSYFGFEDGKIVAYDKPAGEGARTKLVDARGEALPFETALKKLVETDPDRDHVLKSKMAAGAGSKPGAAVGKTQETDNELSGARRISAILSKGGAFGK